MLAIGKCAWMYTLRQYRWQLQGSCEDDKWQALVDVAEEMHLPEKISYVTQFTIRTLT
jgi:hypothetical protein